MNCLNPVVSAVHAMCIAVSGTLKSSGRLVYHFMKCGQKGVVPVNLLEPRFMFRIFTNTNNPSSVGMRPAHENK